MHSCLETSSRLCYAIVLNSPRNRSIVDLTRERSLAVLTAAYTWPHARTAHVHCGVQTGGSVDGVCIIQECVCRRYGGERRTIVMHMFRADAVPHTTTLLSLFPSLSLFRPRQASLSVPTTSFQCTSLIFWPLANTDTIEKSVGLHATAESEWREPVSLSDFDLFAKEVCPLLLLNRVHTESLSQNVEKIDYILSVSGIIGTWRKLSEWSRKILLFEIIFH